MNLVKITVLSSIITGAATLGLWAGGETEVPRPVTNEEINVCLAVVEEWSNTTLEVVNSHRELAEENLRMRTALETLDSAYLKLNNDYGVLSDRYINDMNANEAEIASLKKRLSDIELLFKPLSNSDPLSEGNGKEKQ